MKQKDREKEERELKGEDGQRMYVDAPFCPDYFV